MKIYKHEFLMFLGLFILFVGGLVLWCYFPAMMAMATGIILLYLGVKYCFKIK